MQQQLMHHTYRGWGIYPITPSSPMAELVDEWSAHGRKNMFDQPVKVIEMQPNELGVVWLTARCINHNIHSISGTAFNDT